MKNLTKSIFAFGLSAMIGFSGFAQLSKGGTPFSFANTAQAKSAIQMKQLPAPDMVSVNATDVINDSKSDPYRVALRYPVNYNVLNSGTWETTADGGSLWRLRIHADGAKALGLYYHNFFLPVGGKVFIYNENQNHVIGAFTSDYNFENTIRATQMIQGETITLEYYAPAGATQTPIIEISDVAYFYRGVEEFVKPFEGPNSGSGDLNEKAESCQVDVACSEITGWEEQRDAVVHYTFPTGGGYAVCTASLLNNTAQDCKPYIISAWHCGEPNAGTNISQWVWYWNYQKTTCSTGSGNLSDPSKGTQTRTGGTVVASSGNGTLNNPPGSNQVAGSDFYLVELSTGPDASWNPFYAGWNRSNTASPSGVGIHHPAGSAKKVSTYTSSLSSATYNGGASAAHWSVTWAQTTNGWGVTEGGSSGSPIYDNNGRMVGQLSGGSSYCSTPTSSDLYGKIYTDWDLNGTANNARLKPWLDPINSGVTVLDGAYEPCNANTAPTCNINASATSITEGASVTFSDASSGNPTTWSWDFNNTSQTGTVTPSTSTSQNPGAVIFADAGTYEVELTATNANGSCTSTETIVVSASTGCDTIRNFQDAHTPAVYGTPGGFYLTGVNEYGDMGKAEYYDTYSPYTHVTAAEVWFYGVVDGGNGSIVYIDVYDDNAGVPGNIVGSVGYNLSSIATALAGNGGQGVLTLPFNAPVAVNGNPFYLAVDFSSFQAGDTLAVVSNNDAESATNTAWEMYDDGTWHSFLDGWSITSLSMYINPLMTDLPVSGTAGVASNTACAGGSFDYTATGVNETDYEWYFPGGTPASSVNASETVTYAAAGNYTAYLFINGNCSGTYLDSVQVTVTDGPTISSTPADPSCAGNDGSIAVTATGGATPYTYSVDGGAGQASNVLTGLSAGVHDVLVTDNNGCTSNETVTLGVGAGTLAVSTALVDPSCANNDGEITITVSGGVTPYSYSIDGGTNTQPGNVFTGLAGGSYSIVVADNGGCQGTDNVTLTASTGSVSVTVATGDPSCGNSDGTITLTASGGTSPYNYSIDGGANFQTNSAFTGLAVGPYSIVVTDNLGCQTTNSATLTNSAGPSASATGSDASCFGVMDASISASATGGTTPYSYSIDGSTFGPSSSFTGLAAGNYTVYVNDASSCQSTTTLTLGEPTQVTHSVTVTDASCGNSNGSLVANANGGTSPYSYSLNSGTGQSTGSFTGLSSGSYTIQVTDNDGCTSTMSSNTVGGTTGPSLTTNVTNETCMDDNGQIIVNASGGSTPYQYSNDGGSNYQGASVFSALSAGTYSIMVMDGAGCTSATNATVTNSGGFTLVVSPSGGQTICEGNSANISASGAGTGATYSWDQGLGLGASHNVSPANNTTYTVIATDNASCTESASVTITVQSEPTVTVIPANPTICSGQSVSLTATGAQSYVWNTGATTPTITPSPTVQTSYTVVGLNGSCAGPQQQVTVAVAPSPTVIAGSNVTSIGLGGTVDFNNAGSNATSYSWNFGDGQTSTQGFVSHTYNVAGTYTVTLTGTIGSCTETDQITIVVGTTGIDQVALENAISLYPNPNNGQFNLNLDFGVSQRVEVRLFSTIGQLVETRTLGEVTNSVVEFDLSNQANGVYFVQINTSSGTITKRITISK